MAEPTDSSLAFFQKGTAQQWRWVYEQRDAAIRLKAEQRSAKKNGPEEFIKLDDWFCNKLPKLIHARKEPHVLYEELVQIAKWRLMMGKYRPKMLDLVRINTESAVTSVTRKAFKKVSTQKNVQQAITMLVNLKGIGPSTASAVLVAAYPDQAPFMSDEGMLSTPGVEATDSTIAEFTNYHEALKQKSISLQQQDPSFQWTPHKVDQVLWIYYLARDLRPQLLEPLPRPDHLLGNGGNGESSADVDGDSHEDEDEEEEDVDDEDSRNGGKESSTVASTSSTTGALASSTTVDSNNIVGPMVAFDENAQDCSSSQIIVQQQQPHLQLQQQQQQQSAIITTNGTSGGVGVGAGNNTSCSSFGVSLDAIDSDNSASVPFSDGEGSCSSSALASMVDNGVGSTTGSGYAAVGSSGVVGGGSGSSGTIGGGAGVGINNSSEAVPANIATTTPQLLTNGLTHSSSLLSESESSCSVSSPPAAVVSTNGNGIKRSLDTVVDQSISSNGGDQSSTTTPLLMMNGTNGHHLDHQQQHHNNNNHHHNNSNNSYGSDSDSRGVSTLLKLDTNSSVPPSEENSIDGGSCSLDEVVSTAAADNEPPLKKQKTLELSSALAAAVGVATPAKE